MLIDLHAHHITQGMLGRHEHWGPHITGSGTLRVGHWTLGATDKGATSSATGGLIGWMDRMSLESRLQLMDRTGVDRLVLSVPAHMYMYWAGDFGTEYAAVVNDELAAFCAGAPDRLSFWGHANLADPAAAAKEVARAVTDLGARGMSMGGSNFGGLQAYDRSLDEVWGTLSDLDLPIFVHGYNESVTWGERANDDPFDTTSIIGMCHDEAVLFWNLINGGVLDRFPNLKVYITHGGGFVPYQVRRMAETNLTMAPDSQNERPLLDYLANFWFDLDLHSPAMRRAVVEDIGADRLLYGSNFGGADSHDGDLTAGLGLDDATREQIRSGNATELLRWGSAA
jgi:aminocarboxymuconate-semialdehyde decarboxylase